MKIFNAVSNIHDSLKELYELTNHQWISDNNLNKQLKKYIDRLQILGVLIADNDMIKWNGTAPTIETSYNFYCLINNIDESFLKISEILNNPGNYKNAELMEAIAFNSLYEKETGLSFVNANDIESENVFIWNEEKNSTSAPTKTITIFSPEYKELTRKYNELKKEFREAQSQCIFLEGEKKLLEMAVEKSKENGGANFKEYMDIAKQFLECVSKDTLKNTEMLESMQGSFRKIIGMLTTVQINTNTYAKILKALLLDIEFENNTSNIHESITQRRENIKSALQITQKLIEHNNSVSHYLGKNSNF